MNKQNDLKNISNTGSEILDASFSPEKVQDTLVYKQGGFVAVLSVS